MYEAALALCVAVAMCIVLPPAVLLWTKYVDWLYSAIHDP